MGSMPIISEYIHSYVATRIKPYSPLTVLDIGGNGRLKHFIKVPITTANKKSGIDGCNLPYKKGQFDASVSVATIEHVIDPFKFLDEAIRVAKKVSMHWFPIADYAVQAEKEKRKLGWMHPCKLITHKELVSHLDKTGVEYTLEDFLTVTELFLLTSLVKDFNFDQRQRMNEYLFTTLLKPYGITVIVTK